MSWERVCAVSALAASAVGVVYFVGPLGIFYAIGVILVVERMVY